MGQKFKHASHLGVNKAVQEAIFTRKMQEAQALEVTLEAQRFEQDNDKVRVVCSGKPTIIELHIKDNCDAQTIITALNQVLHQAHVYRDGMAKDLIGRG